MGGTGSWLCAQCSCTTPRWLGFSLGISALDLTGDQNVLIMPFSHNLMQSVNQEALFWILHFLLYFMLKLHLKTSTGRYMWPETSPLFPCFPFSSVGKLILWNERFGFCRIFTDNPLCKNIATMQLEKRPSWFWYVLLLAFRSRWRKKQWEKETENEYAKGGEKIEEGSWEGCFGTAGQGQWMWH